MPQRIQRRRTKDWRMPEGAVYVGRPSRWGNRFKVGGWVRMEAGKLPLHIDSPLTAVTLFALEILGLPEVEARAREELRGKDLVCWCPLSQPCHADVLLELANQE